MTIVYFLLAVGFVLPLSSIGIDFWSDAHNLPPLGLQTQPKPEPERVVGRHRVTVAAKPVMGQPPAPLPKRPEGRAALKAEIKLAPLGKTPPLRTRKEHPDWVWNTDEHRQVVASFFDGQPDDQAVMRVEVKT